MNDFWDNFDWAGMVQKVVIALIILVITYFVAKAVKWAIGKLVSKVPALQRQNSDGASLGQSLGQIASLLVWLFGLVAILQVFALERVLTPISNMLDTILQFLPNLIGAAFVFFIGFLVAKIVRQLVETALRAANVDRLVGRLASGDANVTVADGAPAHAAGPGAPPPTNPVEGTSRTSNGTESFRISTVVGTVLFGVIMIVVGIAALQILGISAISEPAMEMLNIILNAIPAILAAIIILGIGYLIARFVGSLLEPTLRAAGTDRAAERLELMPAGRSASALITTVAKTAIVLFFAVAATRMLGFPEITAILDEVLRIGGRVLFGIAIIAAGYLIAQVISRMVEGTARQITRYGILVLFAAIGLRYMGLADSIVNLAFGSLVVGAALAAALAFGLGGRDAAARKLNQIDDKTA